MHPNEFVHFIFSMRLLLGAGAAFVAMGLLAAKMAYGHYRVVVNELERAPVSEILRHPEQVGISGLTEVSFPSSDGLKIAAWYVPSQNGAAVVVAHGSNADRGSMVPEIRILANAGFGVIAADGPGQGYSEGIVRWDDTERHALVAAVDWLSHRTEVRPNAIGGLGFSMGGLVMAQVAASEPRLNAVVLEAAPPRFVEYAEWNGRRWGPLSQAVARWAAHHTMISADEPPPVSAVGEIAPRSLLVIGGENDAIVPPHMAQELYEAAEDPKALWIVPRAAHGAYATASPTEYRARLIEFFESGLSVPRIEKAKRLSWTERIPDERIR